MVKGREFDVVHDDEMIEHRHQGGDSVGGGF